MYFMHTCPDHETLLNLNGSHIAVNFRILWSRLSVYTRHVQFSGKFLLPVLLGLIVTLLIVSSVLIVGITVLYLVIRRMWRTIAHCILELDKDCLTIYITSSPSLRADIDSKMAMRILSMSLNKTREISLLKVIHNLPRLLFSSNETIYFCTLILNIILHCNYNFLLKVFLAIT